MKGSNADNDAIKGIKTQSNQIPIPNGAAFDGSFPLDEIAFTVIDAVFNQVHNYKDLEIEAKIGVIVDKASGLRISLPVKSETLLDADTLRGSFRFVSDMSQRQHKNFNHFLNQAFARSQQGHAPPIKFKHISEIDSSYDQALGQVGRSLRVTTNRNTGELVRQLSKVKLFDLFFYCPNGEFDWRLSFSREVPFTEDIKELRSPALERLKERYSYSCESHQIDLTLVEQKHKNSPSYRTFELEIELLGMDYLAQQAEMALSGEANYFRESVLSFVNTVRTLARLSMDLQK